MKTRDLIALLQAADPGGDAEVCVSNEDIIEVSSTMPGYYDGTFMKVHTDDTQRNGNNLWGITSVEMGASLPKIKLRTMGMKDAFIENPDAAWIAGKYNDKRDREFITYIEYYKSCGRVSRKELEKFRKEYEATKKANDNTSSTTSGSTQSPTKAST
ncbi:MAG: hypothetical protein WC761_01715 [Candidatus Paceibacterota bacterium]|jgi:hypothetical protein